jgi:glycosyltransferase involved in cell wall biosynthesis
MRPGKIIHVMTSLKLGGAESLVIQLARLQVKNGLNVEIISLGKDDDHFVSKADKYEIKVLSIGHLNFWRRNFLLYKLFANASVLHFHSPWGLRECFAAILLQRTPRIIYTRHGNAFYADVIWRNIHALLQSRIDAITFVSTAGPKVFQRHHHWPEHKIHVIENGVAIHEVINEPNNKIEQPNDSNVSSSQKLRLGSVGRMVGMKSQDDLLKAVALLPDLPRNAVEIHFFGDGDCENTLKALAKQLNLPAVFHGSVNDIERIYQTIDVLVVTSENEGLSMAIMEAMAHSIPVIATAVGGNPSLVKDQQNGFLIPYGKPDQLAKCIEQLLAEPELRKKFGAAGLARIKAEYSLQKTADAYLKLYTHES